MTRVPRPAAVATAGPFESEADALAVPQVRAIYGQQPGLGRWAPLNHRMLCEPLEAAGVTLGAYDHKILRWLAEAGEPQVCAVVAGLLTRAAAGTLAPADKRTMLDGLDDAAEWRERQAAQWCDNCEDDPAGLCGMHAADLGKASAYRALAARLGEQP